MGNIQFEAFTGNDLVEIRNLQPADWPDIIPDIRFYINSTFCHPIKAVIANIIVGTGTMVVFENTCWIAHIIVGRNYRNKGIGTAIVNELMKTTKSNSMDTCSLIATDLGKPLYLKAGYRTVAEYSFLERIESWTDCPVSKNIVPFEEEYRTTVYALDKLVSGENREKLLAGFLNNSILYVDNGNVLGFYIPGLKEGLIYAITEEAGIALMNLKYAKIDKAVLPAANATGIDFLLQNGFSEIRKGSRMIFGKDIDWKPQKIFSRIGGNFG
jgi:GNAT superfamily N-acetyltransferase